MWDLSYNVKIQKRFHLFQNLFETSVEALIVSERFWASPHVTRNYGKLSFSCPSLGNSTLLEHSLCRKK